MLELKTKITSGGRIVLPAAMRKALGVEEGDSLIIRLVDGELHIFTPQLGLKRARQIVQRKLGTGRSLSRELQDERRTEAQDD